MDAPLLRFDALRVAFRRRDGWHPAVRDLSFDVMPRETVALVGESGSGKSVTALAAMRLLPRIARVEGRVLLGDRDLLPLPEAEMQRVRGNEIAMIFQEPMTSLNPTLTIGDQIAEVFLWHRGFDAAASRREALRMLDKVRLPAATQRFGAYPHQLSGGMRQRVMIAIALACQPKLLVADEPTTALDVTIQAQILALIKTLQEEEGMSVLFITHDMGVVAEVADRCVVMLAGKAIESGRTAQVFARPQETYTRALLAAVPRLGAMRGTHSPQLFSPASGSSTPDAGASSGEPTTQTEAAAPLLSVRGLVARFDVGGGWFRRVTGRIHAVEDVSFELRSGETLSLVGESGCGKSTVGRCILRLLEPVAGSIRLEGREIRELPPAAMRAERRKMQMIFQDPVASLDPRMRIGAAIGEPLTTHGLASGRAAAQRVAELLRQVELDPGMAERFPHEFSGGQRQRICIARALAVAPRLIVADEAVSALDVSIKAQIIDLMLELQARFGLSFLFISHDMAIVERISHRVAVMYLGEIVEIGPRAAVFENPQHPYTRRLLAAIPVPDPARRGVRRMLDNDEIRSPIRPLHYAPPTRSYAEAGPGHVVQRWDDAWRSGRAA